MRLIINEETITSPFAARPDASIDFETLKTHYQKHPERWETAFKFLSEIGSLELEQGRMDLSEDVFYTYSEYVTKNEEDAYYESHEQYIDIQYLIEGEEYIQLTRDTSIPIKTSYDKSKDIVFYESEMGQLLLATPEQYFIFFPQDIHKPCIKKNERGLVKKIVVKVKYI
ncbi:MAG: DUF386 domain-containing protein [Porphyromonadaceae bacterium]|nr:DUF386 domain-containing protein [Porphyromonadaceae bacterium]